VSKTDTLAASFATLLLFPLRKRNLYRAIPATLKVIPITEAASQMSAFIRHFFCNETGATAIEYGLIAAGIACAIIAVVSNLGSSLNTTFTSISTALK
jgi:pilus assembly protein Flp/PilA